MVRALVEAKNTDEIDLDEDAEEVPIPQIATLEATQGQIDGFFSQPAYKCHQNRVTSVGD